MSPHWPYPRWIAHRGAGKLAPENTLAAFRMGAEHGYRMFECDAKLSADGVVFLMHDATLERTTNGQGIGGDLPWQALSQLDAGSWHSRRFAGEALPTLEALARFCLANRYLLNIEIKPTPGTEAATGEAVARLAARLWAGADVPPLLTSFKPEALAAAQQAAPELPRGLLLDELWSGWLDTALRLGCHAIVCNHKLWDTSTVTQAKAAGMRTLSYTVNDEQVAQRLIDDGYDIVALMPSCALMLKFEWPLIVPDASRARPVRSAYTNPDAEPGPAAEQQARVRTALFNLRQQVNEAFFAAAALQARAGALGALIPPVLGLLQAVLPIASSILGAFGTVFGEALNAFLEENPDDARAIINKVLLALKARKAAKAAKDSVLRKGALDGMTLPGKLADCSEKKAERCELYLVEGDSAGGSAKQGRDRKFQAAQVYCCPSCILRVGWKRAYLRARSLLRPRKELALSRELG